MNADLIPGIPTSFLDPAADTQSAFRAVLSALSRPGRQITVRAKVVPPHQIGRSTWILLLALLDSETTLQLAGYPQDDGLRMIIRQFTETNTAPMQKATHVLVRSPANLPPLAELLRGSDLEPHLAATVIVEVVSFDRGEPVGVSGPGIDRRTVIRAEELDVEFWRQWDQNVSLFPRGVDLILSDGESIIGLPRTARRCG